MYSHLRELNLSGNNISVISSSAFNNTSLSELSLSRNKLTVVPDLKAIRETLSKLYLTNNLITDFDGEVCSGSLEELYIGRNKLTSIKSSTFDSCTALKHLSLNSNQLTVLGKVPFQPSARIAVEDNPLICDSCLLWLKDAEEYTVSR